MNEYLKQYIELQKQFRETEGNPDSVRALYAFKEKLEQSVLILILFKHQNIYVS